MKTPKEYIKNLKNGILTDQMISDVLFSYSKRAKNYRDKNRELRAISKRNRYYSCFFFHDIDDSIAVNNFRKQVLYDRKSDILEKVEDRFLKCIHKQDKHATRRIYDYEKDYRKYEDSDDVVWSNCYYDRDTEEEVWFIDVVKERKEYLYFKFYELSDRTFHTPITEEEALKYASEKNLEIEEIDDLVTYGEDTGILLSLQFCDKVYKFLYPDKKIYKISQPVCISRSYLGDDCRFYSDEEIIAYKKKKEEERIRAAEERERKRIEHKIKAEEEKRLKKIADAEHKKLLEELLKDKKETDWNIIGKVVYDKQSKDIIFEKILAKLPEEQREEILNGFWESEKAKVDTENYEKMIYPVLKECPEKPKSIMMSVINYIVSGSACSRCQRYLSKNMTSILNEYADKKKEESFVNMVKTMISYNDGKMRDEGKIQFIRTNNQRLCFCKVPLFGNIYDEYMFGSINKYIPKAFKLLDKKEFNKLTGGNIFTIETRLRNRYTVGYDKFTKEVKSLQSSVQASLN